MKDIKKIICEEIEDFVSAESPDLSKLMGLVDKYPNSLKYYRTPLPSDKFVLSFPEPKDPNMLYDDKVVEYEYHHDPWKGVGYDEPHWTIRIKATTPSGSEHGMRRQSRTTDTKKVYQHMMRTLNTLNKLDKNAYILNEDKENLVDYFANTWSKDQNTVDTINGSHYLKNKYALYLNYSEDEWNMMSEEDLLKIWNAWDVDYTSSFRK